MSDADNVRSEKRREIVVLGLAPALIIVLTVASWVLARWHIGPLYLNAALALAAVLLGGTPRFINVIGLGLSVVGMMTPIVAVLFQEAGCVTVVISSTLLLWSKGRPAVA